jgi:hypothetical protein
VKKLRLNGRNVAVDPSPAGAGGFQVAGLINDDNSLDNLV